MSAIGETRGAPPLIMNMAQQGERPLLRDFDELQAPPVVPHESRWRRWGVTTASVLCAGGCLALRLTNYSRWTNAIGSFGTGYFTQGSISSRFKGENLARMRQLCFTAFGQIALFALSQGFANTGYYVAKTIITHIAIAELGANVENVSRWLWQERAVRVESHALSNLPGDKFKQLSCVPRTLAHVLKIVAAGTCGAAYFLLDDPVVKGLASFGALFYTFQVIGERLIIWVDAKIGKHDTREEYPSIGGRSGTCYRGLKTGLITVAYIAIPLGFIPYTANPDTEERLTQLVYVGGIIGFFDGIMHEGKRARFENVPINKLDELRRFESLREKNVPGKREKCPLLRSLSDRVFGIAVPIIAGTGLIGFVIWQEGWVLDDTNARISLGTMLGGFLATSALCNVVDWTWDPNRRHYCRDKLMAFLFVSPRLFGINPLYLYLAGTNALAMDNHEIETQESKIHTATIIIAWGCYGFSMARELYVTSCNRIGSAVIKFPLMAIANAAFTTKLSISGAKISPTEVMP